MYWITCIKTNSRKNSAEEVKHIIAVADSIIAGEIAQPVKEANLIQLEEKYHKNINRKLDNRHMGIELYRLAEEQMARVPKKNLTAWHRFSVGLIRKPRTG